MVFGTQPKLGKKRSISVQTERLYQHNRINIRQNLDIGQKVFIYRIGWSIATGLNVDCIEYVTPLGERNL